MIREHVEMIKEVYADIELDEPTEEEWDRHTIASMENIDADRYAATPEREI